MIPEFAIREWSEHVPWTESEQVEQDLLICRALTEIYKDEYLASHLAFRGGTALHKLFLSPQPRYSEDIDLVQINAAPIKETYDHIRDALAFLGEPKVKQKKHNNTLIFRLESESIPVVPIHLKVEINCKEHFSVLPTDKLMKADINKLHEKDIIKIGGKIYGDLAKEGIATGKQVADLEKNFGEINKKYHAKEFATYNRQRVKKK